MTAPVLITGGSSLLGVNWALTVRRSVPVVLALHRRQVAPAGVTTAAGTLETVDDALRLLDDVEPGLVVHAAGLTSVEACEADPALAHHVNAELAGNVAAACHQHGVRLIHVSTDHLFGGGAPLVDEEEPVRPLNAYARSKAHAERAVLERCPDALVVRTNFYGWGPSYRQSFSDRVIDALRAGRTISLFEDVFYTPILASVLAEASQELAARRVSGIWHVVADERISKFEFGLRIAGRFGLDAGLIRAGRLANAPGLAPRPRDMSLSNRKACALLGHPLGGVDEHLALLADQERSGLAGELRSL